MTTAGLTWLKSLDFIQFNPPGEGKIEIVPFSPPIVTYADKPADYSTGKVDMVKYLAWLKDNGYTMGNLQVQ